MRARSIVAGLATTAVTVSVSALVSMAPASADPASTPDANDIVGVGSDTTENVMDFLADGVPAQSLAGYNTGKTAADPLLASFDTEGSAQITLRAGSTPITRPVGSGAGKALLYGGSNNPDVTFARSSSALNATEVSNNLFAFPFALDSLKMAVSGNGTHAPASLTGQQVLDIYKGNTTDWQTLGGQAGTIHPFMPQAGSGTANFFMAQLVALNGGNTFTLGSDVDTTMHENTDDVLKNDPDAVAPFSVAKQTLLYPTTVHLEGGFSAQRAVYNVVRQASLADQTIQGIFGETGFICSTAARALVEAAGMQQLATPAHGGVCGQATQAPTSDFTLNQQVATTTKLTGRSTKVGKATLTATVTGSSAPSGTVDFYEGATLLQAGVPMVSGQATCVASGAAGTHGYTATFVPDSGSQFDPSQGSRSVYLKARSAISETFPAKVAPGDRAKGVVTVTLAGVTEKATGTVKILNGKKTIAQGRLAQGKVTIRLPRLAKGSHTLKAVWGGDAHGVAVAKKFTITQR